MIPIENQVKEERGMDKKRSRFITFLVVFSMVMSMGVSFASPSSFGVDGDIYNATGSSTNNLTNAALAWNYGDDFYLAVISTHNLDEVAELYVEVDGTPSSNIYPYTPGVNINIGGDAYNPEDYKLKSTGNAPMWSVFKFENKNVNLGSYTFMVDGIGGGHDIENVSLVITEPDPDYWTVEFVAGDNGSLTGTALFEDIVDGTAWDDAVDVPTPVANEGYEFDGWTPSFPATVDGDLTFTANFKAETVDPVYWTVTFYDHDDTVLKTQDVLEGTDATPPSDPTRSGYTFDGWVGNWTNVQQNEEVYADYDTIQRPDRDPSPVRYTVTFIDYDDSIIATDRVDRGDDATPPEDPTRDGFTFEGWDGNWTNVRSNEDVYAIYEEIIEEIIVDEEPIAEAPPVVTPPEVVPPVVEIEVPDEPVAQAAPPTTLPKTGTVGAGEMAGLGALLMAIGILLKKKKGF